MQKLLSLAALVLALATGCSSSGTARPLTVGFTPWENPQDMARAAGPISEILSKATGRPVEPFLASDYSGVIQAMKSGKVDIAFFPPGAYVMAEKEAGARVILKSLFNGKALYYSVIITNVDSGVKALQDLKGKRFAFVDPNSTSGGIYPKVMLANAGINPERDFKNVVYAGGHDAVLLAVLSGRVEAGATYANDPECKESAWTTMLKDPKQQAKIRVLGMSAPIPSDNIAVRKDLDPALVQTITKTFLDLSATPEGRARIKQIYKVEGFTAAAPSDYAPVREAFTKVGIPVK